MEEPKLNLSVISVRYNHLVTSCPCLQCVTQVLPSNSLKENCTRTGPRKHAEAQRSVPAGLGTRLTEGLGQQTRGGIVGSDQDSGSNSEQGTERQIGGTGASEALASPRRGSDSPVGPGSQRAPSRARRDTGLRGRGSSQGRAAPGRQRPALLAVPQARHGGTGTF